MRVLFVPELYRPDEPSANGTLADAVTWVEGWLDRDPSLHVYWLVAPEVPDDALLADHEQVTAIRAEPFGPPESDADGPSASDSAVAESLASDSAPAKSLASDSAAADADLFTEGGYSWAELAALKRAIYDRGAYLDAVVDQRRTGRFDLHKWLCQQTDQWAADVAPFDVVVNVHDLQVPRKYRYCSYRGPFQGRMEMAGALFADGIWFKAGVDADRLHDHATDFFRPEVVDAAVDDALETGSPIDFSGFEESYADRPEYLHLAGSLWAKKHADRLLEVAERLHDEFGIETLLTSMEPIPDEYVEARATGPGEADWVHAYPEADRETYETALQRGDLAVCASEYETMARTPFEQAASGQVLVLRDEPWIYDCVPEDYRFAGDPDELGDLAVRVVRNWDEAVRENRRLVEHVREVRDPDRSARRTLRDLRERVGSKREAYELGPKDAPVRAALAGAGDAETDGIGLRDLRERTANHTDDGRPVTESADYALADLVYALRSLGYRDAGNPGTPVFVAQ